MGTALDLSAQPSARPNSQCSVSHIITPTAVLGASHVTVAGVDADAEVLLPIVDIAAELGLSADDIELHGKDKAKIPLPRIVNNPIPDTARLVLITSVNPTPAGEGKSTIMIGLADALHLLGKKVAVAMREPSLGPVFGVKGGATGGGKASVGPMVDINLNFTGDLHALTAATNAVAAFLDNHLQHGNELHIDPRRIVWKRALDVNDRALRNIIVGLGGRLNGVPREDSFEITAASELMAVLCLTRSYADLKARIGRMVVAYDTDHRPVTVADLGVTEAVASLLRDAVKPNLVQTLEGTPVIMHGGPFANISVGCNSVLATRAALALADITLTEAGFGADLGAEKFCNLIAPQIGKEPDAIVLVLSLRSIKMHGGVARGDLALPNPDAVAAGFANARQHIENARKFGVPVVVAVNRFSTDPVEELDMIAKLAAEVGVPVAMADVYVEGGRGGISLAESVLDVLRLNDHQPGQVGAAAPSGNSGFQPLFPPDAPVQTKIETVVREIYRGDGVNYSAKALKQLKEFEKNGWGELPVCIAKTQYSFSDDASALGAPRDFKINVQELTPRIGAGFIVVRTGDVVTMPGLPKNPAGLHITLSDSGDIEGVS